MKKVMLGVSLYPEQETLEEIDAYLKKHRLMVLKKYLQACFQYQGQKKKLLLILKILQKSFINMIVSGDCNSELFHRLEATETDFRFLKILG